MKANKFQIDLAIYEYRRTLLKRIAAERIIDNPTKVATGASIATEILCSELKNIENIKSKEKESNE